MAKKNKEQIIADLPTLEEMEEGSSLLENIEEEEDTPEVEEEAEIEDKKKEKEKDPDPKDKKKEKEEESDSEEEYLTEEEEKEIFESLKDKDPKKFNEAEKEIFDKYNKEEDAEESFWEDVEAITGNPIEVEYGEIDSETPEGAALREQAVVAKAQQEQLTYLEQTYPEAFKILQHYANGGKVQDLMAPGEVDYSIIDIKEENVEQQKKFLTDYYMNVKGFSELKASKLIEVDEESDTGLYQTAKDALSELKTAQDEQKAEILKEQEVTAQEQRGRDKEFIEYLMGIADKGELGEFIIPEADKKGFTSQILERIQRDGNGGYVYNVPITNDNLSDVLQEAFFGFKKGDLSKFIKKRAKTENVKRIRSKALAEQKKILKSTLKRDKDVNGLPTFEEFSADKN